MATEREVLSKPADGADFQEWLGESKAGPAVLDVCRELARVATKHGPFVSLHEGYAVLLEEVDELWDAIKGNSGRAAVREEAVQVAAMAVRIVSDLCPATAVQ